VLKRDKILGESPQMMACLELLAEGASSLANVLINGETGTGKELFARAIHENSPRANNDFVVVDCTALPENLVESLLFGYKRGAFTGADKSRDGLIKQADGGTLFLDEIGELPSSIQGSFLRVIQERRFRPLGARVEESSDFRLIAATNRDLEAMVESGSFREDLLFRLRSLSLSLPPLRERREDIKGLALHYTTRLCERYGWETKGMSADFFCLLGEYSWPGNVRELISVLERSITAASSAPILIPQHLPTYIRVQTTTSPAPPEPPLVAAGPLRPNESGTFPTLKVARDRTIAELEADYMQELMSVTGRNIKEACRLSGLSRTRVYALLKKYNLAEA
jgi:two-component system NtrC family response regulator